MASTPSQPAPAAHSLDAAVWRLQLPDEWELTDDTFLQLCALNDGWQFETDADGGLLIMAGAAALSGERELDLGAQVLSWSRRGGTRTYSSSTIFRLADGSRRSADVAWLSSERLAEIDSNDESVWAAAPDFVIEIRSRADRLSELKAKLEMWIANGVRLAWLVDPFDEQIRIYRPGAEPELLQRPSELEDAELLPGLTLDLSRIWR